MRRKASIKAVIEVQFHLIGMPDDEREVAYPELEITYSYLRGSPAVMYQRNGDPGWPAEPAELDFISAKLINGDGLAPAQEQIDEWAQNWLDDNGFDQACAHAEEMSRSDPDDARDRARDDALMARS